ncbi:MAG: hypothetical protein ACR2G0_06080 [Chthoniobacterales bacterium]
MKNTAHLIPNHRRSQADLRHSRDQRIFPPTSHNFHQQQLPGSCGQPLQFEHPAFFKISNDYFAGEAARNFVVDSGVFAALIVAALLPIANGFQAVATLIHSVGVL